MYKPAIEKSVYISPSTQEKNIGQGEYGAEEIVMNLIADIVCPVLVYNGITVYRNTPNMTHVTSMQDSNSKRPGIHFAIHSNATGLKENKAVRGCEVYYCAGSVDGKRLAEAAYKRISDLTPVNDRGVRVARFTELTDTNAPSALIEIDYHDNLEATRWILGNIKAIALGISQGICDYFSIECKTPEPEHWAEKYWRSLAEKGVSIQDKRYNDTVTRGELFALLDRIVK